MCIILHYLDHMRAACREAVRFVFPRVGAGEKRRRSKKLKSSKVKVKLGWPRVMSPASAETLHCR